MSRSDPSGASGSGCLRLRGLGLDNIFNGLSPERIEQIVSRLKYEYDGAWFIDRKHEAMKDAAAALTAQAATIAQQLQQELAEIRAELLMDRRQNNGRF
jgi:hypothetical protein